MTQEISENNPDSKDHEANMGPTWVLSAPGGPHVGPINLPIRAKDKMSAALSLYDGNPLVSRGFPSTRASHTEHPFKIYSHSVVSSETSGKSDSDDCLTSASLCPCTRHHTRTLSDLTSRYTYNKGSLLLGQEALTTFVRWWAEIARPIIPLAIQRPVIMWCHETLAWSRRRPHLLRFWQRRHTNSTRRGRENK